jgi:hypothetical protein
MKGFRQFCIALVLFIFVATASNTFAQQNATQTQGPPHPPGLSGICTGDGYVYVLAGNKIYQYLAADLSLVSSIGLPKPAQPENSTGSSQAAPASTSVPLQAQNPPPPMGSGICSDETYLYVLAGNLIMQYSASDMSLLNSVKLPAPEVQGTN